jgi:hypothetical protein
VEYANLPLGRTVMLSYRVLGLLARCSLYLYHMLQLIHSIPHRQCSFLQEETRAVQEGDNDANGDGQKKGCTQYELIGTATVEQQVEFAV